MTDTPTPTTDPTPAPAGDPPTTPPAAPDERLVPLARFETVTAQKYEAIRRAEAAEAKARELEAQLTAARTPAPAPGADPGAPPAPPAARPLSQADLEARASELARAQRFNERCNEDISAGRKAHADFDAVIAELSRQSPTVDANGRPALPPSLVEAALETGRGHEVLYALGKDLVEADRVMTLSPTKQAVELARLASRLETESAARSATAADEELRRGPEGRSSAPATPEPIVPRVGGSRNVSVKDMPLDDPRLPIEEFMRRRDAESAGRRSGRAGMRH